MKEWIEREAEAMFALDIDWDKEGLTQTAKLRMLMEEKIVPSAWQTRQIQQILDDFSDVFSDIPETVQRVEYQILTPPGVVVHTALQPTP